MKDVYRIKFNKDVYKEHSREPDIHYTDEYVHWLESELNRFDGVVKLSKEDELLMFDSIMPLTGDFTLYAIPKEQEHED